MDLFREWSKDVAKKVENAVDEVVKEVDNVSASVNSVQPVPQVPVQTKVVSRIDIKTADRNELIQFIKDQNQHLNRLQLANKQCEQRIVQLEEQKLQHLELINTLNEDLKQSNEDLKMQMEGTKKLVQENQNQKTILENSRKLALENEELKLVIEKLTNAAEKAATDLLPQSSSYGSYGSLKQGANTQEVSYGGYGSYGSADLNHFQRKEKPRTRRKKEKKRKAKYAQEQVTPEHEIVEEPEGTTQLDLQIDSEPIQNVNQEEKPEDIVNTESVIRSETDAEQQEESIFESKENEIAEIQEGSEAEEVHSINKANEQSKSKFKEAKEALAAKRNSLRLVKSASREILNQENENANVVDSQVDEKSGKEDPDITVDYINIQPEIKQPETIEEKLENPQDKQVLTESDDASYEDESEDNDYSDEDDSGENEEDDSYESDDSDDYYYNTQMYSNQRRSAPIYSEAQEKIHNQIVQQSSQQHQQLKFQHQQIQQLKEDKEQLIEENREQQKKLDEVKPQQQQQQKLKQQLIEASNTITELERLKEREKQHSEDLEKQVDLLKLKMEEINEQFSSYRRRAQALIEQNETSYGTEGNELVPTNEEKNLFLEKMKEMEQENASLKALYSEEQVSNKNKISLFEQKYEMLKSKLKDSQMLVKKLEGELAMSKEGSEKALSVIKENYEKELATEAMKYKDDRRLLEEKLNNVKANSFNQLRFIS